uniref:Uncharacterized protein n=1 Tax=Opuntia streptacantha TaxID=393608 RepID=A0A7C9AJ06_OPUST
MITALNQQPLKPLSWDKTSIAEPTALHRGTTSVFASFVDTSAAVPCVKPHFATTLLCRFRHTTLSSPYMSSVSISFTRAHCKSTLESLDRRSLFLGFVPPTSLMSPFF